MGEIANIYDGTHKTPVYKSEGVPFVSVQDIKNLSATTKFISIAEYEKYKIKPKKNDIFMTRIGDIGTCAIVENNDDLAYYVTLALIRPNGSFINSNYLKFLIESTYGKKELNRRTLFNAVPIKINLGDIGKIKIPLPSLEVQEYIVNILEKFESITNNIKEGLPKEIELRKKQYVYYREKLLNFQYL